MRWAAPYQPAVRCTTGPTRGARALLAWLLETYAVRGMRSGGIYNCRPVRGGTMTSTHGEGRGIDGMIPATPGKATELGSEVLNRVGAVAEPLGVQTVIYARRIYSAQSPDGRPYAGVAPHWDHLHMELTRPAAADLTLARCRQLLDSGAALALTAPPPPAALQSLALSDLLEEPVLTVSAAGPAVAYFQECLRAEALAQVPPRPWGKDLKVDGKFEVHTQRAVDQFQRGAGLVATGAIDGVTGAVLTHHAPAHA